MESKVINNEPKIQPVWCSKEMSNRIWNGEVILKLISHIMKMLDLFTYTQNYKDSQNVNKTLKQNSIRPSVTFGLLLYNVAKYYVMTLLTSMCDTQRSYPITKQVCRLVQINACSDISLPTFLAQSTAFPPATLDPSTIQPSHTSSIRTVQPTHAAPAR
jgi:hypothetical protein